MNKETILYAFIVIGVLCFFSALLQLDSLEVITKPMFLPLLFLFYYKSVIGKIQKWVVFSFVFFYIAELLLLYDNIQNYLVAICMFLVSYLLLLYYIFKDLKPLLIKKGINKINGSVVVVFALLVYLYISMMLILDVSDLLEQIIINLYGFVLLILGVFAITVFVLKNSLANLFLVLTVIAFVVSDLFFILIKKIEYNIVFMSVNMLSQMVSYYFFANYAIFSSNKKKAIY